jgi:hypothetical protein
MRLILVAACWLGFAGCLLAADPLREHVLLFDQESTFGWDVKDEAKVAAKQMTVKTDTGFTLKTRASLGAGEYALQYIATADVGLTAGDYTATIPSSGKPSSFAFVTNTSKPSPLTFSIPKTSEFTILALSYRPTHAKPIFDGKTLDGWKLFQGDPKRELTKFEVTKDGELRATNGPGDLQTTAKYSDFALRLECKTNGKALNSGIFFRCIEGQYQNGYECQIQNGYKDDDRTKPSDFGTGAIYRRLAARKIVASDNEWFSLTLIAVGPTMATWVNGYPVLVWTDDRPKDENPRKGLRLEAGHLSIQGHDPTTDLLFRKMTIADWK